MPPAPFAPPQWFLSAKAAAVAFLSTRPRLRVTIYLGLGALVVAVGLWIWVHASSAPGSAPGEQTIQQDAAEHGATADQHASDGAEKHTNAIQYEQKANEHRARRRAIRQQADQQSVRIDALPDSALPSEYADSVTRARAAIERARRERGADAGSDSPAN